ncbi:sigma-54-dependent Fis family transcriptional regulator [Noviherbaspirillum aridicola]|uniref:Sigma-54-dependent Fis family transcriptional regulator n=1 Tax=Noviherbaspirillum aridicola TaxID=2849687 RepID=A0ABQ4Q0M6_9BURK|nr:sigma-54-dependent Fis family transcriptional regulator [Noviherbaspirillum aridicola]GIZ50723.1 sigma-54-dependent Fis family transcriptional regulator [Noviherbaspirillum aridicola]
MTQTADPRAGKPGTDASRVPAPQECAVPEPAAIGRIIEQSWQRSAAYGLDAHSLPDFSPLGRAELALLVERNRLLYRHALPVMETLHEQIAGTHSMVVLTDAGGTIVHSVGDDDFLRKADRVALRPGAGWSEQCKGTNAIGTAIAERVPSLVHAGQHYLRANHFLTCSAAPIFDHEGKVVGVLDVSGEQHSYHRHTMALVRMSAQMIENQLFSAVFQDAITLHFHSRPEFIGTLMEGIASFTPGGRFLSANRNGLFQLGLPLAALRAHSLPSLFGLPVSALMDHYRSAAPGLLDLCLHSGVRVYARAELRLANRLSPAELPAAAAAPRMASLRALDTGDAQVAGLLAKVEKVIGRDIPVMITGETGTGKELLARAIHQDSPRAGGPFVAVNCAAIPESLIESELFGYEDGAFTGARKKGSAGKIVQAHGGTLFLDEIGDMPLAMQARLLRVLQERTVTPLGGRAAIPVDVALVCATHRNLRDMIAARAFREDLYYRLNGLVVKLPALRDRRDLAQVIDRLLMLESAGSRPARVSEEAMALFRRHAWPGNIRQLASLLRTALLMAGEGGEIRPEHLPEDFLEDVTADTAQTGHAQPAGLQQIALSAMEQALREHGGNVSAAARALGISRNTMYRRLRPAQRTPRQ